MLPAIILVRVFNSLARFVDEAADELCKIQGTHSAASNNMKAIKLAISVAQLPGRV